jgi:large subunit ribosomal protein L25
MAHTEIVHVEVRATRGTRNARRMRAKGQIPAVLYGHGEATESLTIPSSEVEALLRHGGRVVELQGAVSGSALVRAIQWDSLGADVLHLDLARVSSGELVEMKVPIELRGVAPGTRVGGILEHVTHEVEIRCPVAAIPERIQVNVNSLELGQQVLVSDLTLPEGATMITDGGQVVVHCIEPAAEEPEAAMIAEGAEPEVIGRRAADEEGEGED